MVYRAEPVKNFSPFSNKAHQLKTTSAFYVSSDSPYAKFDQVEVSSQTYSVKLRVEIDKFISGEIGYISTFDTNIDTNPLFDGYRFAQLIIKEVK